MGNFKVGQIVKFKNPEPGEEAFRFIIIEIHDEDMVLDLDEKLLVEEICDYTIKPRYLYLSKEFTPSYIKQNVIYNGKQVESLNFGSL